MIPITLPPSHRRAALRSFWALIAIGAGAGAASLAYALGLPAPLTWGGACAAVSGTLVFSHESVVRRLYNGGNRRLALPVARWCARYVMRVCFFIVFVAAGRAGSNFITVAAGAGAWRGRPLGEVTPAPRSGWMRACAGWAFHSGNAWSVALLPFLFLIRLLAAEQESAAATNIYTLF